MQQAPGGAVPGPGVGHRACHCAPEQHQSVPAAGSYAIVPPLRPVGLVAGWSLVQVVPFHVQVSARSWGTVASYPSNNTMVPGARSHRPWWRPHGARDLWSGGRGSRWCRPTSRCRRDRGVCGIATAEEDHVPRRRVVGHHGERTRQWGWCAGWSLVQVVPFQVHVSARATCWAIPTEEDHVPRRRAVGHHGECPGPRGSCGRVEFRPRRTAFHVHGVGVRRGDLLLGPHRRGPCSQWPGHRPSRHRDGLSGWWPGGAASTSDSEMWPPRWAGHPTRVSPLAGRGCRQRRAWPNTAPLSNNHVPGGWQRAAVNVGASHASSPRCRSIRPTDRRDACGTVAERQLPCCTIAMRL